MGGDYVVLLCSVSARVGKVNDCSCALAIHGRGRNQPASAVDCRWKPFVFSRRFASCVTTRELWCGFMGRVAWRNNCCARTQRLLWVTPQIVECQARKLQQRLMVVPTRRGAYFILRSEPIPDTLRIGFFVRNFCSGSLRCSVRARL